ncbi:MAG: hypothetical protein NVS3B12_34710 [Acidimicrobiales bacterium]
MANQSGPTAEHFDGWYADMAMSSTKDEIVQRHLGLPPHLLSTSLLSWEGIGEVIAALRLSAGQRLMDLACGRGGYGLEVAARTGARLVGVDFSAEAVRQAEANAARLGSAAQFSVGDLAATGLESHSVDSAMCVDAIQFADQPDKAYQELRRVVRPGGRVVLTCWEAVDRRDERIPEGMRKVDLRAGLTGAGFVDVDVADRPAWLAAELAMWDEAAALQPGDDAATEAFRDEGVRVRPALAVMRRVIASATAPSDVQPAN